MRHSKIRSRALVAAEPQTKSHVTRLGVALLGMSLVAFALVAGTGEGLVDLGPMWLFWYLGLFSFGTALLLVVGAGLGCVFRGLAQRGTSASGQPLSATAITGAALFAAGLGSFGLVVAGNALGFGPLWAFWYFGLFTFGTGLLVMAAFGVFCMLRGAPQA